MTRSLVQAPEQKVTRNVGPWKPRAGPQTPFTPPTRLEEDTGQRFTTHASSLSALSSLPRELLEPVVAVDDFFIFVVDVDGVVAQQRCVLCAAFVAATQALVL